MRQKESISSRRKGKHLNWEERVQIEVLQRAGTPRGRIAEVLGRSDKTIKRELNRGWVLHRVSKYQVENRYSSVRGQTDYESRMKSRNSPPAVDPRLQEHLRLHIIDKKQSPEVVAAGMAKQSLEYRVCAKTIYNMIDRDQIPEVSNQSLWEKRKRKGKHRVLHRQRKRSVPPEHSIENRPVAVESREEFGHWEIDLIVGGKGKGAAVLLTLTERKTRKQIIRKLKDRTQGAVLRALNGIERQMGRAAFRQVFKSITADNGSEFLDHEALEQSVFSGKRTHIYYAHPYSSWERGSNENANRMIRRFIPKGSDISTFSVKKIKSVENWINNYPRKILGFYSPEERFAELVAA